MSSLRLMTATDLLSFNQCNLDHLTENYSPGFYLDYLTQWPQCCQVLEDEHGQIEGYILGKVEASPYPSPVEPYEPGNALFRTGKFSNYLPWHAHVSCLTVSPAARRRGHATKLTAALEKIGERENCWFVDLFVRVDNTSAIKLYEGMGYSIFRRIIDYHDVGQDAFDMRKPLGRDKDRMTIRDNGADIRVSPDEVW